VIPIRFLAGEYPGGFNRERVRQRMDSFLETGLNTFINLTGPDELPPYLPVLLEEAKIHHRKVEGIHLPIRDFGLPTREEMLNILNNIDNALEKKRNVYLHCWGGIGRTGTTVGCYLVRHGMTGEQALAQLADWWQTDPRRTWYPRTPETDEQVQFVREWHELA
jgi:protein-tyrosine phosphatase